MEGELKELMCEVVQVSRCWLSDGRVNTATETRRHDGAFYRQSYPSSCPTYGLNIVQFFMFLLQV